MDLSHLVQYLKSQVEPLPDSIYGNRYRASVHLKDSTYLPCVIFQSKQKYVGLAKKRLEEQKRHPKRYPSDILEHFIADRSCLALYDILSISTSPFAWPLNILQMIHGETSMGWTAFVVEKELNLSL
jgi:hypothetical protein